MMMNVQSRLGPSLESPRQGSSGRDAASSRLTGLKYLIVDHIAYRARMLKDEMKAMGMRQCDICDDPTLALQLLNSDTYGAVVIAFDLPTMNGPAFVRQVRAKTDDARRRVPIVMITSDSSISAIRSAVNSGVDEFVITPFSAKDLFARIQRAVMSPREFIVTENYVGPDYRPKGKTSATNRAL